MTNYMQNVGHECFFIWPGTIIGALTVAYIFIRGSVSHLLRILRSMRFDFFGLFIFGLLFSIMIGGIGTKFYASKILLVSPLSVLLFLLVPVIIGAALIGRTGYLKMKTERNEDPFFISDVEGKYMDGDLLDYAEQAKRFAERVYNGGSSDSLVFGIDAPWGVGKSTFVNFCIESWEKEYDDKIILYKFNPLRYEDQTNLLEKFIDGLVATLQNTSFAPEIRPLISRYSRLIKSKATFSVFGIGFELSPGKYTVDDAFDDLEAALAHFDKKIVIVVDDLDRLTFPGIKDVLFAIKKSFTLPNISYVLCYDTENIAALEKDSDDDKNREKIREFLEKFVNVKISLFLDGEILSRYVEENFGKALGENLQIDPLTRDGIRNAIDVVLEIYKSKDFHYYQPFLGDIRKLKRLINTMMLFEIEKTDFDNSDFNKLDLVHLLLIYINYPNIFRKIYNTETGGKRGFFTALIPYDDGYLPKPTGAGRRSSDDNIYKNSVDYSKYIEDLSPNQRFLVNKVFDVTSRLSGDRKIDSVPQVIKKTYACFNGDGLWTGGRNLPEYLQLIVKLAKPQRRDQYQFYLKAKDRIIKGESLDEIFKEPEFLFSESEGSREQFWNVVANTGYELPPKIGGDLITYLLEHITDYSLLTNKEIGVGLRDDIEYHIIKLLDRAGWSDPNGEHEANTEENIKEIAEWIFGEGKYLGKGVIETLGKTDRGVMGLYDLVVFRLHCSADRGGDIFNLTRALSKHGNSVAPTEGNTGIIAKEEMREISQKVFTLFKEQYITPRKNFFDLVDAITLADATGKYLPFIEAQITCGKIKQEEVDVALASIKIRIKGFVTYQIGNSLINLGVGCGYYDETGNADGKGIATAFNAYLFEVCFDPAAGNQNYEHFLDYLLAHFTGVWPSRSKDKYIPNIGEFTKVLDRTKLVAYWRQNSATIKALNLEQKNKVINTGNYAALYSEDLKDVFEVLDKLVEEVDVETVVQATAVVEPSGE